MEQKETTEVAVLDQRSLVNLCLDLVEVDPKAPENQEFIKAKLNQLGYKVDAYVAVNQFANSQIDSLKRERDFLDRQISNYKRVQQHLKDRALFALGTMGATELKGSNGHKMYISTSEYVDVSRVEDLPDHCVRNIPARREPNKEKIKQALKGNEKILGCSIQERQHVKFK